MSHIVLHCLLSGLLAAQKDGGDALVDAALGPPFDAAVVRTEAKFWGAVLVAREGKVLLAKGYG